jgi:hypothetical protein
MKIKKGLFTTEIDIQPGELKEFQMRDTGFLFYGLLRWLDKHLDFQLVDYRIAFNKKENDKKPTN